VYDLSDKGIAVFHVESPSPSHHALFYHAYQVRLEAVKAAHLRS